MLESQIWKASATGFSLVQERSVFYFIQAFNWLDDAHPHAGGQSDSKFTDLNVILIPKHLTKSSRIMFGHRWALRSNQICIYNISHHGKINMLIVQHTEDTGKRLGYPSEILYHFQTSYFNETNKIQSHKKGDLNLY